MGYEADELIDVKVPGRPELQVLCRSISIGRMLDISETRAAGEDRNANLAAARGAIDTVAEALVSWNLERQGVPIPATPEGVRTLGPKLLMDIYTAYVGDAVSVPEGSELGKDSPSGAPSPGGFAMTELPSESPPNSDAP